MVRHAPNHLADRSAISAAFSASSLSRARISWEGGIKCQDSARSMVFTKTLGAGRPSAGYPFVLHALSNRLPRRVSQRVGVVRRVRGLHRT